ncbi:MAG: SpoIIE family protein phosphatase [Candidatus Eremiobacteraeota bacterium]|nr:SpoIIE family protein phosphatase [Candidatus Eremiobacteraeota bacterium]
MALPARVSGTLLLTAFLVLALVFAVQGAFQTRASIADTFAKQSRIQAAQLSLEELLRLQIDEENSLRGYALTHDPFYVGQYRSSAASFDATEGRIRTALQGQTSAHIGALLSEYSRVQSEWRHQIAEPVLANPGVAATDRERRDDKAFSDYQTRVVGNLRDQLAGANADLARSTQAQLDRTSYSRAFWLLVFGLLSIIFNAYSSRLNRELEEERTTTEVLQAAFRSESMPLPNLEVGSAYQSAGKHLAVGGDVFDVYRLSGNLALVLIADVSGKGVDAAVLTAFIKFTIRGIALRRRDPSAILAEFNTAFSQTVENPYLFVSMFVGILNTDDFQLAYASAGHDSAFIRRSKTVQQLSVTGPVLGVMEEPFATKQLHLQPGDVLVLATDGLTEARDRNGTMLLEAGAMKLIAEADPQPQRLADELVGRVRALSRNRMRDDLAILALRPMHARASDA